MINAISSPQVAAALALGISPFANTSLAMRTKFRDAVKRGDMRPFRLVSLCFYGTMARAASYDLARFFSGQTVARPCAEQSPAVFAGFHRRGAEGHLYHPNSRDYEIMAEEGSSNAEHLYSDLVAAGVNPAEATEVLPMASEVTAVLSGSVLDFYHLYRALGRIEENAHPAARDFAWEVWDDIAIDFPDIGEVFNELAP